MVTIVPKTDRDFRSRESLRRAYEIRRDEQRRTHRESEQYRRERIERLTFYTVMVVIIVAAALVLWVAVTVPVTTGLETWPMMTLWLS